jgi:hypothetical protein
MLYALPLQVKNKPHEMRLFLGLQALLQTLPFLSSLLSILKGQ